MTVKEKAQRTKCLPHKISVKSRVWIPRTDLKARQARWHLLSQHWKAEMGRWGRAR